MNNVIPFPVKTKDEYYLDDSELVNTDYAYVNDDLVKKPKTAKDYLHICKFYLSEEDYRLVLCGIVDMDYYKELDNHLKGIVNAYFSFPEL